ncbi:sulfate/molybdate ABC transporter ATP-binding protein [Testudinibacter sp. TR-2022]|uniref:sulfate/molybdate ABC transporter ATP-binding protein n=1 Tax=Testudinibacter sp. TR-2022 TaxID=2585029 RepID=UPI001119DF45|nr:TOBE-like domain-containing protein [Testudinibacter sp. TR-2022]TNH05012.1 sulfate ABC transporter ATP-binding protein [Pasteurellaceae bacterium Phil11]TNH21330.1 sulfate ABC transporter ATP-binding protein [Testudinibacter sp. TR-2022]TNH26480.1 sulfate ABC transporter ATP-binding protein [Testudinibacter sp. TR-2022]
MSVTIQNLNKHFGDFAALKNINLELNVGELTALLGPSGCGKTSLLRIIAGLDFADSGKIWFANREVTELSAAQRKVGFVFQHYALFRQMTIFDNVAFGLQVQPRRVRPSKAEIADRVFKLLHLVKLEHLAQSYPDQLSGGQRQRVALARALAVKPEVLLLDEPFGALDAQVRKTLRRWLRTLQHELNITTVFVTHDQEEALEVSDRVVVMNQGRVEQVDLPRNIYYAPQTEFVTEFVGDTNVFHGHLEQDQLIIGEFIHQIKANGKPNHNHGSTTAYVRPYELTLSRHSKNALAKGEISHIYNIGFLTRVEIHSNQSQQPIEVLLTQAQFQQQQYQLGETVFLIPDNLNLFQNMNL